MDPAGQADQAGVEVVSAGAAYRRDLSLSLALSITHSLSSHHDTDTMSLPPLADLTNQDALHSALSTLFEPTPALTNTLLPAVIAQLSTPPASYAALVDLCAQVALAWDWEDKAAFVAGHPMIGEVKGLSAHSAKEQGGVKPTAPVVLDR